MFLIRKKNSENNQIKLLNDLLVLPEPSAILLGIETEHLLICELKSYLSCLGKESKISDISLAISNPNFQIFRFL